MNFDGAKGYMVGNENEVGGHVRDDELRTFVDGDSKALARQNLLIRMQHNMRPTVYRAVQSTGAKSPEKPADSILVHGDVRRMLLNVRANNEASRAFAVMLVSSWILPNTQPILRRYVKQPIVWLY